MSSRTNDNTIHQPMGTSNSNSNSKIIRIPTEYDKTTTLTTTNNNSIKRTASTSTISTRKLIIFCTVLLVTVVCIKSLLNESPYVNGYLLYITGEDDNKNIKNNTIVTLISNNNTKNNETTTTTDASWKRLNHNKNDTNVDNNNNGGSSSSSIQQQLLLSSITTSTKLSLIPPIIDLNFTCPDPNYINNNDNDNDDSNDDSVTNSSFGKQDRSSFRSDKLTSTDRIILTMIVTLKGQLGNMLSYLSRAYAIKRSIEQKYSMDSEQQQQQQTTTNHRTASNGTSTIEIQLIGERQFASKKLNSHSIRELLQCFPNVRHHLLTPPPKLTTTTTTILETNDDSTIDERIVEGGKWDKSGLFLLRQQQQNELLLLLLEQNHRSKPTTPSTTTTTVTSLFEGNRNNTCSTNETVQGGLICWQETYCTLQSVLLRLQNNNKNKLLVENSKFTIQDERTIRHDNDTNTTSPTTIAKTRTTAKQEALVSSSNFQYSLPYLMSTSLGAFPLIIDEYYDNLRYFFQFDQTACCGDSNNNNINGTNTTKHVPHAPYDDEIVIHIRNFNTNLRQRGFHQMDPSMFVSIMLQQYHHQANMTRIAIVAFGTNVVNEYITELVQYGYRIDNIRHIQGSNPMEDFCFLLRTKYHLIGMKLSTFAHWSAILSNATKARLYVLNSTYTMKSTAYDMLLHDTHTYKHPDLYNKIQYEIYDDVDDKG